MLLEMSYFLIAPDIGESKGLSFDWVRILFHFITKMLHFPSLK